MFNTQRRAGIVGVYTTEQARFMQRSAISLQLEAVKGALDDAGLPHTAVDGLIPLDAAPNGWRTGRRESRSSASPWPARTTPPGMRCGRGATCTSSA